MHRRWRGGTSAGSVSETSNSTRANRRRETVALFGGAIRRGHQAHLPDERRSERRHLFLLFACVRSWSYPSEFSTWRAARSPLSTPPFRYPWLCVDVCSPANSALPSRFSRNPQKSVYWPGENAAYEPCTHGSSTHESRYAIPLYASWMSVTPRARASSAASMTAGDAVACGTSVGYPAPARPPV